MLMKHDRLLTASPDRVGLVIVFPPAVRGLFNPTVHRLVRAVEEQLDNVFVTYALSNGASPDFDAAFAAARFAGCSTAVVIHTEDWVGSVAAVMPTTDTVVQPGPGSEGLRLQVRSVLAAFQDARAASRIAA
jgi:hypothetical protein